MTETVSMTGVTRSCALCEGKGCQECFGGGVACSEFHTSIADEPKRKVAKVKDGWMIFCPACECAHHMDSRWTFNGDFAKPTFSPSLLMGFGDRVCHSFVKDGRIQFLGDCWHELKGKTVDLPDFDDV